MFQSLLTRNVSLFLGPIYVLSLYSPEMYPCSLVQYMFQSLLTRNVSLFLGPIYVLSLYSPGMYPCSLVQYMFQSLLTQNVSLFLGPIYASVSTHPECILVPWSNICFSLYSLGMYPCSLVQYMFQSLLTRNVSLVQYMFQSLLTRNVSLARYMLQSHESTDPECILVSWSNICFSLHSPGMCPCSLTRYRLQSHESTDPECILVSWSNICFSLHSPGMYPCSLARYMFQSLLTQNVSLDLGPIYYSVSTHLECILVPWPDICFSLYSPGMYPCSLVQYILQSPLTRNVSLFLGPIYTSVSTHPECILVPWSNIYFSLHSPGMYPCSLVQYILQSLLTRNVSLFLGPIYASVSTRPECILVPWSNICFSLYSPRMYPFSLVQYMFQSLLTRNVSLDLGPIYASVSTHPECILVPWSNICFSLHSPGMYPCSLVQYMLQSPLTQNVSLDLGPIYYSVSTHLECILVPWSNICFSLYSPGMYPCSLVQYMFQSLLTRNVSLFLGPIYASVSTHPECILVPWSNICSSLHSPRMYPCSLVQYMLQFPLTRNVSLFLGPIYASVSTHLECILVHWSNICFSLHSPRMYPCSLARYMFQSPLTRNVSLFIGQIYASVSTHLECILVLWSNICFSLHSPGMYPCSLVQYMFQSPLNRNVSLFRYIIQSPLTRNVSLFLGPIYVSVSTHSECILVPWSNICFESLLTRNVSLFLGPIYVSVSTHSECILVPWSNICFSLYSLGMYPCSLVQYMFQSLLTWNVSLFLGPIYVSVSTHPECILGPIYVSVSTHPECILGPIYASVS